MITFKDTDLREALRRKYANTPTLPADFMEKRKLGMAIKRNEYEQENNHYNPAQPRLNDGARTSIISCRKYFKSTNKKHNQHNQQQKSE